MEVLKREEMRPATMWDLTHIYESREAWERDCEKAKEGIEEIKALPGTLGQSEESLKRGLDTVYRVSETVEKVNVYAFLQKSGDNGNPRYQTDSILGENLAVSLMTAASFLNPELLSLDPSLLERVKQRQDCKTYRHMLSDTERHRPHTLDEKGEKMLAMLRDATGSFSDIFDMFESVDMTFPDIHNEKGETCVLSHGTFGIYRESPSEAVRKEAFEAYFGAFRQYLNTLAATYSGSVKTDVYYATQRHHKTAREASLFSANVPTAVYDSLLISVKEAIPHMEAYLELRKKALHTDTLHMYDLYCPMVENAEFHIPFDRAKEMVKNATACLGEEYGKLLDRAFNERWIDVYENRGKTTGAYSCGVYGVHPYVLLNYTDTLDDVFTLAHELGHAMHSYFSDRAQDYVNHDYEITVAEVASTVNEVLLTKYLLKTETDPRKRAYILNHFLEGFRTTVFRQTLFAEFEQTAHEMHEKGEPLTAESLTEVYHKLNNIYYPGVETDALYDMEWARIPHFYRAFYVYQYATGFCSAVAIAENITTKGGAAKYLSFLSTGGSDYPIEELKIAGVDLSSPETVKNAMKVFASSVEEMKAILLHTEFENKQEG